MSPYTLQIFDKEQNGFQQALQSCSIYYCHTIRMLEIRSRPDQDLKTTDAVPLTQTRMPELFVKSATSADKMFVVLGLWSVDFFISPHLQFRNICF